MNFIDRLKINNNFSIDLTKLLFPKEDNDKSKLIEDYFKKPEKMIEDDYLVITLNEFPNIYELNKTSNK